MIMEATLFSLLILDVESRSVSYSSVSLRVLGCCTSLDHPGASIQHELEVDFC